MQPNDLTLTGVTALIGASTGIAGLVLGIVNYLRDRPRVFVNLLWDMSVRNDPRRDPQKLWGLVKVTNAGRRPVYVSHASLKLPRGYEHTHLVLGEGLQGNKLAEGAPPVTYTIDQEGMQKYARDWRKIYAVVLDITGKRYRSKVDKSKKPSWAM